MDRILYDARADRSKDFYFNLNEATHGTKVVLHLHNSVELKFIMNGDYSVTVSGKQKMCGAGDVVFVNSRCPHSYESVGSSTNYVLIIDQETFRAVCPKGKVFPLFTNLKENFKYVSRILDETFPKWDEMSLSQKRGFVFRILGSLLQYSELVDEEREKEDVAVKIIEYIREHCHENITLDGLAKTFGYTKNYFSNIFNNRLKMGLRECVNRYRIDKALQMIQAEGGKTSFCSIAERCGYESMNTFYRAFKKYAKQSTIQDS